MNAGIKLRTVSPRTFELLEMDTIESQFPVSFDDGGGYPLFVAYCAQCNHPIENQHLRGVVSRSRHDQYTIEAAGACFTCNIATPVHYRLHQDGTMTGISPDSGEWTSWDTRPGLWRGMLHALFPRRF